MGNANIHSNHPNFKCNKEHCNSKSKSNVCFGDYVMKKGTDYLYHGSPSLFSSPYLVDTGDNRLSPEVLFPSFYATKNNHKIGFIYKYRPIEDIVVIPNILFACGKFHEIKQLIDDKLSDYKEFDKPEQERSNASAYDSTLSKICTSDKKGIFIPSLENQILLCGDISTYLELDSIHIVIKTSKGYKYIKFDINDNSFEKENLTNSEYEDIKHYLGLKTYHRVLYEKDKQKKRNYSSRKRKRR